MSGQLHKELFQTRFEALNNAAMDMSNAAADMSLRTAVDAVFRYIEVRDALHKHVMQIIDTLEK